MTAEQYVVNKLLELEEVNSQLSTSLSIKSQELRMVECDLITVLHLITAGVTTSNGKNKTYTLNIWDSLDADKFACLDEIMDRYNIDRPAHEVE